MSSEPRSEVSTRADAFASAVLAGPLVAELHGGRYGHVATYLPGRRVPGIVLTPQHAEVHLVGRYPGTVAAIAAQVRTAATPIVGEVPVAVAVEDLTLGTVADVSGTAQEESS